MEELIEKLKAAEQNPSGMFEIDEDTICAVMEILTAPPVAFTEKHEISNMEATGLYLRAWPGDRARNEVEGYTIPLYLR